VSSNRHWLERLWLPGSIALVALAASFNGALNAFTYDDLYIVHFNGLVHGLNRAWMLFLLPYWPLQYGGDGYRPLTMVMFALEWVMAPDSATLFHMVSIALYAVVCVAAFRLARALVSERAAWVTAALFAAHPLHVEAVASVVGQSELLTALLLFVGVSLYLQARAKGGLPSRRIAILAAVCLAACLFKEHGVVLPALFLAAEATVVVDERAPRVRVRALAPAYAVWLGVTGVYLGWRWLVIGHGLSGFSEFVPFVTLKAGYVDRVLTMLGVVPTWMRLMFWPVRLTTEYGPPELAVASQPGLWQLPGLLIVVGVLGLGWTVRRRFPVMAFGIAWFALTLLPSSNLLVPSGILVAERTLFAPSFGALLAVVAALSLAPVPRLSALRIALLAGTGALIWLGVVRSITRTADWRNNDRLFDVAVETSPNTYRSHYMRGAWLMSQKRYAEGEREYFRAIALFPQDPAVMYNLGQEYFYAGNFRRSYLMFDQAERLSPRFFDVQARKALALAGLGRYGEARILAAQALQIGVGDTAAMRAVLNAADLDATSRRRLLEGASQRTLARPR
jgi:hypothetical protein